MWFALTRTSQENVADNASSSGAAGTSQTDKTPPVVPGTRATDTPVTTDTSPKDSPREPRAELGAALKDWVAATNSRDLDRQMAFYAPTLNVFYRKRNATQASVRAEKTRLQSQSASIEVRVGEPEIQIDADGQTATMRFNKSWSFNGASPESGEVIQELRWRKTDSGWKITSERDVEVIRMNK
jgi:ketosteroid isomerase-like protein